MCEEVYIQLSISIMLGGNQLVMRLHNVLLYKNRGGMLMAMFVGKKGARNVGNQIDKIIRDIDQITQSEIDRVCDRIDSELNSCGRELSSSIRTLEQIKPLLDKLVGQVAQNAPEHMQVLVQSIAQEISSKVSTSINNQQEVQKNIKDVDKYTNEIDALTDKIDDYTNQIDTITDKFQD